MPAKLTTALLNLDFLFSGSDSGRSALLSCTHAVLMPPQKPPFHVPPGNEGSQAVLATVNSGSLLLHFRKEEIIPLCFDEQMILPLL